MQRTFIAAFIALASACFFCCSSHDNLTRAERIQTQAVSRSSKYVYHSGHVGWSKGYNPVPPSNRTIWVPGKWYKTSQGKIWIPGYRK
ncbi:hypothetical protein [Chryseolinea soli]|uniref:hypothetical protein n=1 Tax=Chryseolinea soli TaxID=2321403 RepID=UPI00135C7AFA|nr:hypothetical protein [Chryseolinea soli]